MMLLIGTNTIQRVVTIMVITVLSPMIASELVVRGESTVAFCYDGLIGFFGRKNVECTRKGVATAFPFLNEQLVTTIVSVLIIYTVVPFLFARYDAILLTNKQGLRAKAVRSVEQAAPSAAPEGKTASTATLVASPVGGRTLRTRRSSTQRIKINSADEEGWASRELRRKPVIVPNPEITERKRERERDDKERSGSAQRRRIQQ